MAIGSGADTSGTPGLRPLAPADHEAVLALNAADVTVLAPLDADRLTALLDWAAHGLAITRGGRLAGFVLTVAPGAPYDSPNYRWFADRRERFLYLDRIVVASHARRTGLAQFAYASLEATAWREHGGPLVCEVDVDPPNRPSLAFHRARGFHEVGRQAVAGKVVALMEAPAPQM